MPFLTKSVGCQILNEIVAPPVDIAREWDKKEIIDIEIETARQFSGTICFEKEKINLSENNFIRVGSIIKSEWVLGLSITNLTKNKTTFFQKLNLKKYFSRKRSLFFITNFARKLILSHFIIILILVLVKCSQLLSNRKKLLAFVTLYNTKEVIYQFLSFFDFGFETYSLFYIVFISVWSCWYQTSYLRKAKYLKEEKEKVRFIFNEKEKRPF